MLTSNRFKIAMFAKPTLVFIAAVTAGSIVSPARIARSFGSTMSAPSAKAPEMLSV